MNNERIIDIKEVIAQTSLSRSQIYRLEEDGLFPVRVQVSEKRIGWYESEIQEWIRNRREVEI